MLFKIITEFIAYQLFENNNDAYKLRKVNK